MISWTKSLMWYSLTPYPVSIYPPSSTRSYTETRSGYLIAAASIVAKVQRDNYMIEIDALYPEYGFAKNKGYGTAEHIAALKKYGPCPIHRRSFIKNFMGE